MDKYRRSIITMVTIVMMVALLTKCIGRQNQEEVKTSDWPEFAGSAACEGCHKDIYAAHIKTAHFLTTKPATETYIKGSFAAGKNKFLFNNGMEVAMEKRNDSFYQVAYLNGIEKKIRRFDIVIGSGTKGQSFLNWKGNRLFQMPITYFTAADQWSNSPGYPGKAAFDRPITSRCMECHTTYAEVISPIGKEPEAFDRNKILYGVDCEKCHGPAALHVEFQTKNPLDTTGKYIVKPEQLSRQQNLDLCALCHGGRLVKTSPSFSFTAGDTLSKYFAIDTSRKNVADIDVHGNQYGLLASSKCFNKSQMTCSSCHNTHENEKGKLEVFSQRCLSCHKQEDGKQCKLFAKLGPVINKDCIDCHMPKQASRSIAVFLQGENIPTPALLRTHFISIYPEETKKVQGKMAKK
ncbi:cytochrome c3 family protein [Flavihumibacter profundi]|uniref:cytochrome c3 family protein n=1 Tax=Flavihumibacter profundi TaxID=2716883 RepID=UPI001CC80457|nr:cytochrome c3 family protein [Flavihumibacter profundi]MBZ5857807.1 cytochrome c3 family protein [Flavihumibacter profundi]